VNSAGSVLERVQTLGGAPYDLALTKDGDLLYTDNFTEFVYLVKNGHVKPFLRTHEYPSGVCSTLSGDILVVLNDHTYQDPEWNDDIKAGKYRDADLILMIQFNEDDEHVFESGANATLRVKESPNGDACFVDYNAKEVIIISPQGNVKSRYAGHVLPSGSDEFCPHSITTDSHGHILVSDFETAYIHVLDMDGQFLSVIECNRLSSPLGVSVDSQDRLWVVDKDSRKVFIIKYLD
jgi:streptogramin lyase